MQLKRCNYLCTSIMTYRTDTILMLYITDSWFSKYSIFEALDLEVSEKQLQSLYDIVVSDNDILSSGLKFHIHAVFIHKEI